MEIKLNLRSNPKSQFATLHFESSVEIGRFRSHFGFNRSKTVSSDNNLQFSVSWRFPNELKRRALFFCYLSTRMREIGIRGKWIHRSYFNQTTKKWVSQKNPNDAAAPLVES